MVPSSYRQIQMVLFRAALQGVFVTRRHSAYPTPYDPYPCLRIQGEMTGRRVGSRTWQTVTMKRPRVSHATLTRERLCRRQALRENALQRAWSSCLMPACRQDPVAIREEEQQDEEEGKPVGKMPDGRGCPPDRLHPWLGTTSKGDYSAPPNGCANAHDARARARAPARALALVRERGPQRKGAYGCRVRWRSARSPISSPRRTEGRQHVPCR